MRAWSGVGIKVLGLLAWMVWALGGTGLAQADEATKFRHHYEQAMRLSDAGQYQESIKEFQAAYAIKQLPRLLLNLGQVHRRLGHAKEALGYYEFYLRVEPNPEPKLRAELDRYIAQAKAMLEAAQKVRRDAAAAETNRESPEFSTASSPAAAQAPQRGFIGAPPASATPPEEPAVPTTSSDLAAAAPSAHVTPPSLPAAATQPLPLPFVDESRKEPVYKRAWFWGVVGAASAVVIAGVVTGAVLGTQSAASIPGNIEIHNWSLGVRP